MNVLRPLHQQHRHITTGCPRRPERGDALVMARFLARPNEHGANPVGALVQGSDGSFYGATSGGGGGTIFRLTIVSEFRSVVPTNTTLNLTCSTEAGGAYQLQYNPDLGSTNWTSLGRPVTATGATLSFRDSLTNDSHRFYRVVLQP